MGEYSFDVAASVAFFVLKKRFEAASRRPPILCRPIWTHLALADFKTILEKAKKQTVRELSRMTPDSVGAKLLIASTAVRAYRNRHLGTLMRCCEAWKPIGNCLDPISFECVDFQRLSQIIAYREAEITNLLGRRQKKALL